MKRVVRLLSHSLAVLALLSFASPAEAEVSPPLATTLRGEAKGAYEVASTLFAQHEYAGAARKYRAALDVSHDARLLYNIAACEKELHHYARASALVDQFLKQAGTKVSPQVMSQVKATQSALKLLFGYAVFTIDPPGATLSVDGEEVASSPIEAPLALDLGKHDVRVASQGYEPMEMRIEVAGPAPMPVEVALVRSKTVALEPTAVLSIAPSDPRATVYLDGTAVAVGRFEESLPARLHHVRVTADGKKPFVVDVDLARGEHRSLEVTLDSVPHHAVIWPWITAGALVVAGGVVGSYFLVKGSGSETLIPLPAGHNGLGGTTLNGLGR